MCLLQIYAIVSGTDLQSYGCFDVAAKNGDLKFGVNTVKLNGSKYWCTLNIPHNATEVISIKMLGLHSGAICTSAHERIFLLANGMTSDPMCRIMTPRDRKHRSLTNQSIQFDLPNSVLAPNVIEGIIASPEAKLIYLPGRVFRYNGIGKSHQLRLVKRYKLQRNVLLMG